MSIYSVLAGPPDALFLLSPNGGQSWPRGSLQTVTWSFEGSPGTQVKILLLNGSLTKRVITRNADMQSGSYRWRVPADMPKGDNYRIRIISVQNPSLLDSSAQPFAIGMAPPGTKLTMISPNGGESWQRGTTQAIAWSFSGQPGSFVKVMLLRAGIVKRIIAAQAPLGAAGAGGCSWSIPANLSTGSDFRIRVQSVAYPDCRARSNRNFSIRR